MITDDLIKKEFISQIVSRDVNVIYNTQEQVVREVFPGGTGQLADFLARRPFNFSEVGVNQTFYMRIFPYLRFLDIRYRKDQMLYTIVSFLVSSIMKLCPISDMG